MLNSQRVSQMSVRYQFMITAGILAAAAADVVLVELDDGWRYAICLQVSKIRQDVGQVIFVR